MRKLSELVNAGATVAGARPVGPSSMDDDSAAYHALADALWGPRGTPADGQARQVGKGRVIPSLGAARKVLLRDGVAPDFACDGVSEGGFVDWIHRTAPEAEIYFVANREAREERFEAHFRAANRPAEIWDAVTGEIEPATAVPGPAGVTTVALALPPYGSRFVVFKTLDSSPPPHAASILALRPLLAIEGGWQVAFDPAWGGPAQPIAFDALTDWTTRPEDGIRYYSGTAVYRTRFKLPEHALDGAERTFLDLGSVLAVADATLNGVPLGTAWTAPRRLEATRALKPGANDLEIRVTNLWPNRLIADAALPEAQRLTRTNLNTYKPSDPLLPSGLLGPVTLLVTAPKDQATAR